MPPPGGPLIGSGMKAMIAEAASAADMEHRDFTKLGDGSFFKLWWGSGYKPDCYKVTVRDGSVEVELYVGGYTSTPEADRPQPEDYAYLQGDVFDHWRSEIDQVFRGWEDLPESTNLGYDLRYLISGTSEIQLVATSDPDDGGYTDGNARLSGDIDNLHTYAAQLSGAYIYTFNTTYANQIRPNINALHALTVVLTYALAGEAELIRRSRQQVAELCWAAKAAFEASGPKSGGGDTTGLVVGLIVLGAVAAGVAAVVTGGGSVPATVVLVSSLTAAGAGATSDLIGALETDAPATEAPELALAGSHPDDVLRNLRNALDDVNTTIRAEENIIEDLLTTTTSESGGVGSFNINAPAIDGEILAAQQNVSVNPTLIADITHKWIPTINGDLAACASRLNLDDSAWIKPDTIGLGARGPFPAFETLQSQIVTLLHDTAGELTEAAAALDEAARILGLSDEAADAAAQAIADRVNANNENTYL